MDADRANARKARVARRGRTAWSVQNNDVHFLVSLAKSNIVKQRDQPIAVRRVYLCNEAFTGSSSSERDEKSRTRRHSTLDQLHLVYFLVLFQLGQSVLNFLELRDI